MSEEHDHEVGGTVRVESVGTSTSQSEPFVPQSISSPKPETVPPTGSLTVSVLVPTGVTGVNSAISSCVVPFKGTEQVVEVPVLSRHARLWEVDTHVLGTACRYVPVELPGTVGDVGEIVEVRAEYPLDGALSAYRRELAACR